MSDRPHPPVDHPEELLAGYVDGSATPEERAAVEAHLASCPQCRQEAHLAAAAREALASLPELEPPGLAQGGLAGLRRSAITVVAAGPGEETATRIEEPQAVSPGRRPWAPALAIAAAVVVLAGLVAAPIVLRGGGAGSPSGLRAGAPKAAPTESPLPALVDRGASYTPASLNTLARRLSPVARLAMGAPSPTPAASSPLSASPTQTIGPTKAAEGAADQAASRGALDCLTSGGGLQPGAVPVYLEEAAFRGVPAYIGAFTRTGAKLNFVVVAVSVEGCQPLYTVSQPV